eukprot:g9405.t1
MRPILRNDKDLFCVSAWNDNGYHNLVLDPKAAFRTDFFPGLGWMMDKDLWDELRNRWAELGFGSFGTIYLAKHKTLDFKFAVKKVPKAGDPKVTELLMNEVHALMDLDHPHVVKLVRYFDEGNHMYLVFELCEGPDLLSRLEREGRFDENEAASTLRQMLAALKCCHDHYMGHFDVKPETLV